jgi:hypothetical protein
MLIFCLQRRLIRRVSLGLCLRIISLPLTQTTNTLLVFFLAMVLNPEVQAKAQAEIDRVVGKDRLPNFDDRPALPYLEAILRETLRWYPVVPFGLSTTQRLISNYSLTMFAGIPHATTASDIYNGYFIPKGLYRADLTTAADGLC